MHTLSVSPFFLLNIGKPPDEVRHNRCVDMIKVDPVRVGKFRYKHEFCAVKMLPK